MVAVLANAFEPHVASAPGVAMIYSGRSLEGFLGLLPGGIIWAHHEGTNMRDMCDGLSMEGERVHNKIDTLIAARDPRQSFALLDEWENTLALPDCPEHATTVVERQKAAYERLVTQGDYSPDSLISTAKSLGYDIDVRFGSYFKWQLALQPLATFNMSRGSTWDRLYIFVASGGNDEQLECAINRLIPGHMEATFFFE